MEGPVTAIYTNYTDRVIDPFWFERLDVTWARGWVYEHQHVGVGISILYVVLILIGRQLMANRKPFDLRKPLIIWNWFWAIFSMVGFIRIAPTFIAIVNSHDGFYRSICKRDYHFEIDEFWAFLFAMSKVFELIDTAFIVLRKSPLIFLHWFHHMTMVTFSFYLFPKSDPVGRWAGILNLGVHSIMYSYYALKVARIHVPKIISIVITTLQMFQFCGILSTTAFAFYQAARGSDCSISNTTLTIQSMGGIAYLSLFGNYFYQTYVSNRKVKSS